MACCLSVCSHHQSFLPSLLPPDVADSRRVATLLCGFIKKHASKEGLSHSRDLHTMLVAAFWAILHWLMYRPELISDKVCGGDV